MREPLPGYVRIQRVIGFDDIELMRIPPGEVQRFVADVTGQLLTEALLTGQVDTTMPIYVDGARRSRVPWDFQDSIEMKVRLDYFQRQPPRPMPDEGRVPTSLPEPRKAIDG